jgi:hypothetical protein
MIIMPMGQSTFGRSSLMKRFYEKPTLLKRDALPVVAAVGKSAE